MLAVKPTLRFFYIICFTAINVPAFSQTSLIPNIKVDTLSYQLLSKKINVVTYTYGEPHIKFLVIHDNEDTGVKAAFKFIRIYGGTLIDLQYGDARNFVFSDSLNLNQYELDPNSMFTDIGTRKGLDRYGYGLVTPEAVIAARKLGDTVLAKYNVAQTGYIITLHNNSEGAFSIRSYLEGNYLKDTASDVYINNDMDPDDLVLVTEPWMFDYLKEKNINTVYQNIDAPDDGSLSVFAQQNKIPYVNIEVQHGHIDEHFRLINAVSDMLKEFLKYRQQN